MENQACEFWTDDDSQIKLCAAGIIRERQNQILSIIKADLARQEKEDEKSGIARGQPARLSITIRASMNRLNKPDEQGERSIIASLNKFNPEEKEYTKRICLQNKDNCLNCDHYPSRRKKE